MSLLRAMFTRRWLLTTVLVIAGTAICARLGIWQLDRLTQRRAFNVHYVATTQMSPLTLTASTPEALATMEYRAVTVSGKFDFENQVALRNQFHENEPGYFLLTPLILSDGTGILVERGWIPSDGNHTPTAWRKYDQPGEVTISGVIRLGQTQPDFGGVPDPELVEGQTRLEFWNLVNVERISRQIPYKMLPVFVQPDPNPAQDRPPYPYQPSVEITEGPHFGYAFQWFTFASLLFFGYPFYLRKAAA